MVGKKSGRFTLKDERTLISMATNGATLSEIAAKFRTSVKTIERKARGQGTWRFDQVAVKGIARTLLMLPPGVGAFRLTGGGQGQVPANVTSIPDSRRGYSLRALFGLEPTPALSKKISRRANRLKRTSWNANNAIV